MINPKSTRAIRTALSLAFIFGLAGPMLPVQAQALQQNQVARLLVSTTPHNIPATIRGTAKLLIHNMPNTQGGTTRASTLLFVPNGTPPVGGWPVVAWVHGTTTPGQKTCAPSL